MWSRISAALRLVGRLLAVAIAIDLGLRPWP